MLKAAFCPSISLRRVTGYSLASLSSFLMITWVARKRSFQLADFRIQACFHRYWNGLLQPLNWPIVDVEYTNTISAPCPMYLPSKIGSTPLKIERYLSSPARSIPFQHLEPVWMLQNRWETQLSLWPVTVRLTSLSLYLLIYQPATFWLFNL